MISEKAIGFIQQVLEMYKDVTETKKRTGAESMPDEACPQDHPRKSGHGDLIDQPPDTAGVCETRATGTDQHLIQEGSFRSA